MKGLATVRVLVATVTGQAQTTLLAMSVIPLMALSAMLSIRERRWDELCNLCVFIVKLIWNAIQQYFSRPSAGTQWTEGATSVKVRLTFLRLFFWLFDVREEVNRKKNVFFRALPESPKPPPWPQFGQLGPFFSDVKIQDLKVTCREGREMY